MYHYVSDSQKKQEDVDKDIKKEFQAQAKFLTNSNKKLNYQLQQTTTLHREDNLNIMQENVNLIEDVTVLRNAVKKAQAELNYKGGQNMLDSIRAK